MFFNVTSNKAEWDNHFHSFDASHKDIYFSYDYCHLHEANGDGLAKAARFHGSNGMTLLYPFMLKPIHGYLSEHPYFDIESAYGYGGPMVQNFNTSDMEDFEELFHQWCLDHFVVAEFIRFHPLTGNHLFFSREIQVAKNRSTVYIDLEKGIDYIWNHAISSKNRNMIRKAERAGIGIYSTTDFDTFTNLYIKTMDRLSADPSYYFTEPYFKELFKLQNRCIFLLQAVLNDKTIACAVFLYGGEYLHYHLAASDPEYLGYAPNNLLIYKAIEAGYERGLKKFHLGGGLTALEEDTLYKFKKSFSKDSGEFYIGKRIHNAPQYHYFMGEWKKKTGMEPTRFLQYEL
ncbi:MAG: GNAT family N-acetyltransferase [Clostridia bacterium]|nr:GNAT family N-acetyltransferase [Clostridia bacterium]